MQRLVWLMALGCAVVILFGFSLCPNPLLAICVGLMISFASALGAGLVGFIFGVPYSRDAPPTQPTQQGTSASTKGNGASASYRPNTSLEQISDWLTKMLVGVGLVQMRDAPDAVRRLVTSLAPGLGSVPESKAFIASTLLFFAVCGFLFGFLWARLYLRRWLVDADQDTIEKATRFDADAAAYRLVSRQLERREDEAAAPQDELQEAIKSATSGAKARIFEQAKAASDDQDADSYYNIRNPGAESIFRALIADDTQARYHQNHGQLGYTLDRRRPPDLAGAIEALSEAINRRDKHGLAGWRYYEFRRARDRIKMAKGNQLAGEVFASVVTDLKAARSGDPSRFDRWMKETPEVLQWVQSSGAEV